MKHVKFHTILEMAPAATAIPAYTPGRHLKNDPAPVETALSTKTTQAEAKDMIVSVMSDRVDKIDPSTCDLDEAAAFIVGDLGDVYRQQQRWKLNLPNVKPHYGELERSALRAYTRLTRSLSREMQP